MPTKHEIKVAFLEKCASLGYTAKDIELAALRACEQLEKSAAFGFKQFAGGVDKLVDAGGKLVNQAATVGIGLPLAVSGGAGLVAGNVLAKATSPQQTPEEYQKQEVAETYRQYADYLRRQAELSKLQEQQKIRSPSFRQ